MILKCPQCQFEKTIDINKIPATSQMATCPQCKFRFKFRELSPSDKTDFSFEQENIQESKSENAQSNSQVNENSELPKNAVIFESKSFEEQIDQVTKEQNHFDKASNQNSNDAKQEKQKDDFLSKIENTMEKLGIQVKQNPEDMLNNTVLMQSSSDIPFEHITQYGFVKALIQTCLRVLFAPANFFTSLQAYKNNNTVTFAALFYVLLGIFQILMSKMWYLFTLGTIADSVSDQQATALLAVMGDTSIISTLFISPFILLVQLAFYSAIYNLMIKIVQPEKSNFLLMFRVIAYSAAPGILCIVPFFGASISVVWFAVATFVGVKYSFELSWAKTGMALGPLFFIAIALFIQLVTAMLAIPAA